MPVTRSASHLQSQRGKRSHSLREYRVEIGCALVSAVAMLLLVARQPAMAAWTDLCRASSTRSFEGAWRSLTTAWELGLFYDAGGQWLLMTLAMVPVLGISTFRFVAARSFARRRARSVFACLFGYWLVWTVLGAVLVPIGIALAPGSKLVASGAFALAALWQLMPAKARALRRCHQTAALRPSGLKADWDCLAFGFRVGNACVISCGAMMFACVLVAHSLLAFVFVLILSLHERAAHTPTTTRYAFAFGVFALALLRWPANGL